MAEGITGKSLQESSDMLIGEGYPLQEGALDNYSNIPGFKQTTNFKPKYASEEAAPNKKNKRLIAKVFSSLDCISKNIDKILKELYNTE